jgi:hypothetical protein
MDETASLSMRSETGDIYGILLWANFVSDKRRGLFAAFTFSMIFG